MAIYHRASREGATDEELLELAMELTWELPGKKMTQFPE